MNFEPLGGAESNGLQCENHARMLTRTQNEDMGSVHTPGAVPLCRHGEGEARSSYLPCSAVLFSLPAFRPIMCMRIRSWTQGSLLQQSPQLSLVERK